jgi:hypothetical protein
MTGQAVVDRALRRIGKLSIESNESATGNWGAHALRELRSIVDQKNAMYGCLFTKSRATYSWTSSQSSRTIGASGNFAATRPQYIDAWGVIPSGATAENGPYRLMSDDDYASISDKTQTAACFTRLYYKPGAPNGTFICWPVPTATVTLVLYAADAITNFGDGLEDMATEYYAPPGYEDLFVMELACRLAPDAGAEWTQKLEDMLREARAVVSIANTRLPQYAPLPPELGGGGGQVTATSFDAGTF